jgi:hypothetical protein
MKHNNGEELPIIFDVPYVLLSGGLFEPGTTVVFSEAGYSRVSYTVVRPDGYTYKSNCTLDASWGVVCFDLSCLEEPCIEELL